MRVTTVGFVSLLVIIAAVGIVPLAAADSADLSTGSATAQTDEPATEFPVTLTDATGTEITLDERPERVTTTNPSAAQVMWELEAADQVVGLTQFAHYLDGAESRENVSSTEQGISVERVVGTEPDLVLAPNATSVETVETLRDSGLTVYHFPQATDFDDVADKTLTIGQLTGNEDAAHETNAWVDANVEAVSASTADVEAPRLLYPLLGGFAVGGETFIHEIIVASGAENVAAEEFDGYEGTQQRGPSRTRPRGAVDHRPDRGPDHAQRTVLVDNGGRERPLGDVRGQLHQPGRPTEHCLLDAKPHRTAPPRPVQRVGLRLSTGDR